MEHLLFDRYITLDLLSSLQVISLGFIGGTLSGFIGSGGAFFMTPGMMNLGVPGVVAVGSNITHKFGKALVGSKKHGELGNVDKRLSIYMVATAFIGIGIAVYINSFLFKSSKGSTGTAASDLYISVVFVLILSIVAITMLNDAIKAETESGSPSTRIVNILARYNLPPYIEFRVADVKVSLWIVLISGLATGYLAGTIGVGGFIGVPAMIYLFGVPTAVAAGSELYLAMFMGGWGAINYAYQGFVDIRLTMLLFLGSLIGIFIGAYGVKVVKEVMIRVVTAVLIILCVLSRSIAIPLYLSKLGWISVNPDYHPLLNTASKGVLFLAGLTGMVIILYNVTKAYRQRSEIQNTLQQVRNIDSSIISARCPL